MVEIQTTPDRKPTGNASDGLGCAIALLAILTSFLAISWLAMVFWSVLMINGLLQSKASRDFPTCIGVVTSFGNDIDSDAFEIGFEYDVNGKRYQNTTGRDPRDYPESQDDQWNLQGMTTGTEVRVYYDPADPGNSRLVPGILAEDWMFLMATPVLVILIVATWKFSAWMREIYGRLRESKTNSVATS